jgi:ribosomal protein S18 acetylase RimI-like enzyme
MATNFVFRKYEREFGFELLKLWRQSFHRAIGVDNDTGLDAVQIHLEVLQSYDPGLIRVAIDPATSAIAGFMTLEDAEIEHLFVHVDFQRQGLGSQLIDQAKAELEHLTLFTFERNKTAQKFYEHHNFVITDRGYAVARENPWSTSRDQLADIKYEWRRRAGD